jgi:hypothetical protein
MVVIYIQVLPQTLLRNRDFDRYIEVMPAFSFASRCISAGGIVRPRIDIMS